MRDPGTQQNYDPDAGVHREHEGRIEDFLPAALALQERPPSPTGRSVLWLLLILFSVFIAWCYWGEVDIVVTAPGRVIPSGHVKTLQAPETGVIQAIYVTEGDRVNAGDVLVSLDPVSAQADEARLRVELQSSELELSWRGAFERWLGQGGESSGTEELAQTAFSALTAEARLAATSMLRHHQEDYRATVSGFDNEIDANRAEQESLRLEIAKTKASLSVLGERVSAYKSLVDQEYGARVQYLELLQHHTELERSLPVLFSREEQLVSLSAALAERRFAAANAIRLRNLSDLDEVSRKHKSMRHELSKTSSRRERLEIAAPVTGTVQEVAIHTVGGVVNTAQTLLKIVPEQAKVMVEALVQNKDIGFLYEDQRAAVKVDAFNFTKYGLLEGRVANISRDSIEDQSHGWVFRVLLELQEESLEFNERSFEISPGMSVTAEVKTGKRRLIEFVLSPLIRYQRESVRER